MKVYFIKIPLRGVSPMVGRRLRVPGVTSLARLHDCIHIINGWDDDHLNQFRIFGKDYGVYHDGGISAWIKTGLYKAKLSPGEIHLKTSDHQTCRRFYEIESVTLV